MVTKPKKNVRKSLVVRTGLKAGFVTAEAT